MATKHISDETVILVCALATDRDRAEILTEWTGQPYKVCVNAMKRALKGNWIECGVSISKIGQSRPTKYGYAKLKNLCADQAPKVVDE